jgi:hypothetical protein
VGKAYLINYILDKLQESMGIKSSKNLCFWTTSMSVFLFQHTLVVIKNLKPELKH